MISDEVGNHIKLMYKNMLCVDDCVDPINYNNEADAEENNMYWSLGKWLSGLNKQV